MKNNGLCMNYLGVDQELAFEMMINDCALDNNHHAGWKLSEKGQGWNLPSLMKQLGFCRSS